MPTHSTCLVLIVLMALLLGGCAGSDPTWEKGAARDARHMTSYQNAGTRYHIIEDADGFSQTGLASWYGEKFHGRKTASGETYDMHAMTAAHKELPLDSRIRVTNLENGKQATVTINDRGPFHSKRILDLSYQAAKKLDIVQNGSAKVRIEVIDEAANDDTGTEQASSASSDTARDKPERSATTARSGKSLLQAGAFASADRARQLKNRIQKAGAGSVSIASSADDHMHRVQIGPFDSPAAMHQMQDKLTDAGIRVNAVKATP